MKYAGLIIVLLFGLIFAPYPSRAAEAGHGRDGLATGIVTMLREDGTEVNRDAEVWLSESGEYLARVTDSVLVDEVYFDGVDTQFATITADDGSATGFVCVQSAHYLLDGLPAASVDEENSMLPLSWSLTVDGSKTMRVDLEYTDVAPGLVADAFESRRRPRADSGCGSSTGNVDLGPALDVIGDVGSSYGYAGGLGFGSRFAMYATGSHSATWSQYNMTPTGICMGVYNYRNNSTGYIYVSSQSKQATTCNFVGASIYARPADGSGGCGHPVALGGGTDSDYYIRYSSGLWPSQPQNRMCSQHWSFSYNWVQTTPPSGYNAAISG